MRLRRVWVVVMVALLAGSAWGFNTAEELIEELNGKTGHRQLAAAMRLGSFRYPEVVVALSVKLADAGTDATVRAACATSLGKLNDPATYAMIQTLANKTDEKAVVRASCVNAMAVMKGTEAVGELAGMLKTEKNALTRSAIEQALGGMAEKQVVAVAMTQMLSDELAAPSAIRVLGTVGGPAVIEPLAGQLASPKASIRQAVIKALGSVRHTDIVPHLIKYYPKANDAEKGQIIAALAGHPRKDAVRFLIDEMQNPKAFAALRRQAALALGNLRAQQAIKPLVGIMLRTTEQNGLRLTCASSLGRYSDRNHYAIAGLIGALDDKSLAETAAMSLSRITRRFFGTNRRKWENWFRKWRNERERPPNVGH